MIAYTDKNMMKDKFKISLHENNIAIRIYDQLYDIIESFIDNDIIFHEDFIIN